MAKTQVTCALEGGTYDDSPSGTVRHNLTKKHQHALMLATYADANADAQIAAKAAKPKRGAAMQALRDSDAARAALVVSAPLGGPDGDGVGGRDRGEGPRRQDRGG